MAGEWLRRRYGDRTRVEFHDLTKPESREAFADVVAAIRQNGWDLPIAEVDGQLRPLEYLDTWTVVDLAERELNRRQNAPQP